MCSRLVDRPTHPLFVVKSSQIQKVCRDPELQQRTIAASIAPGVLQELPAFQHMPHIVVSILHRPTKNERGITLQDSDLALSQEIPVMLTVSGSLAVKLSHATTHATPQVFTQLPLQLSDNYVWPRRRHDFIRISAQQQSDSVLRPTMSVLGNARSSADFNKGENPSMDADGLFPSHGHAGFGPCRWRSRSHVSAMISSRPETVCYSTILRP